MVLPLVLTCTSLRLWLQELTVSAAEVERAYAGAQKEYEEKMLFLLQKINDSAADAAAGEENTDPSTRCLSFVLRLISSSSGAHDLYYFFSTHPFGCLLPLLPFFFSVFSLQVMLLAWRFMRRICAPRTRNLSRSFG